MSEAPPESVGTRIFWTVVEVAMIAAFIGMLAVMFIQVVSRYALAIGVPWTDETSRFLYIAQIFLGAAIAQRYGAHIRITIFLDMLSERPRRFFDALGDLLVLVISAALIYGAWLMIQRTSNVAASTLPVTMAWLYGVQALGVVLYALLVLRDLFIKLRGAFRGSNPA